MERKRDMVRNTKTLHIVTDLLELPMIHQSTVNTVAYNATTEIICSHFKQKPHTIEMCVNRKFDSELQDKVTIIVTTFVKNHKGPSSPER